MGDDAEPGNGKPEENKSGEFDPSAGFEVKAMQRKVFLTDKSPRPYRNKGCDASDADRHKHRDELVNVPHCEQAKGKNQCGGKQLWSASVGWWIF